MANVLEKVLRVGEGRTLRRLKAYAEAVNSLEEDFKELTDEELKHETVELRERYANGESLDDLLPEAFRQRTCYDCPSGFSPASGVIRPRSRRRRRCSGVGSARTDGSNRWQMFSRRFCASARVAPSGG